MDIKNKARQLKRDIPAIFIALKKKETPWYAKVMALLTVAYALSPLDLVPDFIPVLGYLDDIIILPFMVSCTIKLIPDEILIQCKTEAQQLWSSGKPKKWYYAIPVVALWVILLLLLIKFIVF